ncbi:probable protein SEMI-ROLLED LEAF 2 at N-terminal half [Coccomyxa sp. Obi]|nr:probable protein SEMI-ROLLED LEAF 2 at N-terminal half [Coccomyxa sp. Obi]
MDCNCNCFGIAASSKFPVKRYNLLVPDIFPRKPPAFADRTDAATERKYKKLCEYVDKNPHRGAKVSRRLARRLYQDLRSQKFGNVQIAVSAYIYLLQHLPPGNASLFAREIVLQHVDIEKGRLSFRPGSALSSVVGTLLQSPFAEIRTLGARLLAAFLHIQAGLDYAQPLQTFVPLLCENLPRDNCAPFASLKGQGSSKQASSNLTVASLATLQEYIPFSSRTSTSSAALEKPSQQVLEYLEAEAPSWSPPKGEPDALEDRQNGPGVDAAIQYVMEFLKLSQDPVEGRRIIAFMLRHLDERQLWTSKPQFAAAAISLLEEVCHKEAQDFMLFSAVLQHLHAEPPPSAQAQAALLQHSRGQAGRLQSFFAIPALIACLKELPGVMQPIENNNVFPYSPKPDMPPTEGMSGVCLGLVHQLASSVANSTHVLESIGGISARYLADDNAAEQATDCFMAAIRGVSKDCGSVVGPIFPKPLAQLLAAAMAARGRPVAHRLKAHSLGAAAAALVEGHLRDGHQLLLWSAAWTEVAAGDNTPALFATLDTFLAALVRLASPDALIAALRWTLSLREASLQDDGAGHLAPAGPAQRLTLLFLYNALVARLAAAAVAPKLSALLLPLVASECPHLQLTKAGLHAEDALARYTAADDEAAAAVLATLRSQEGGNAGDLAAVAASSLELSPCLRGSHLSARLPEELQKPFQPLPFDVRGRETGEDPGPDSAELAARLNAIFAAEEPTSADFYFPTLVAANEEEPSKAGPSKGEDTSDGPLVDAEGLLAAVTRLMHNGSATAAE